MKEPHKVKQIRDVDLSDDMENTMNRSNNKFRDNAKYGNKTKTTQNILNISLRKLKSEIPNTSPYIAKKTSKL